MAVTEQLERLERLAECMYRETFERLEDPCWSKDVEKVTLLYGPPMVRPDVFLVSFQGAGEDPSPSRRTWPQRLLYLDDPYRFGKQLRKNICKAGLYEMLEKRTVAMATCFPEDKDAKKWQKKHGPEAKWRRFSSAWVRRLIGAMRPCVVLVFGKAASDALELKNQWRDVVERPGPGQGMIFARAEVEGCPAVYCHHLSRGTLEGVQACLAEVKRIVNADRERAA